MYRDRTVRGVVAQFDQPYWRPLEIALGADIAGWFMWMHEIRLDDGTRLDAYKHSITRRYLHLADKGLAFEYRSDDRYLRIGLAVAIVRAFAGWEQSLPPHRHVHALRMAVETARRADRERVGAASLLVETGHTG